eukprot:875020_1
MSSLGDWQCARCKEQNVFCEKCIVCGCPHPKQTCSKCTYSDNTYNATECELCQTQFTETVKIISRLHSKSSSPPLMEPKHSDNTSEPAMQDEEEDEEWMDFTQYDDSHAKHDSIENTNNMPPNAASKTTDSLDDMSDHDEDMQHTLNLSQTQYEKEQGLQELRRASSQFDDDEALLKHALQQSLIDTNHNDHGNIMGDYTDLFAGYSDSNHNRNHNNNNALEDDDDDDDDDLIVMHDVRKRKRKRKCNTSDRIIESPRKKRKPNDDSNTKQEDEIHELIDCTDSISIHEDVAMEPMACDGFDDVDPESLPKKDRKQIELSYQKFLQYYLKGAYALRTVCIEYGPRFAGRSAKFRDILSDTDWRPQTLGLAKDMAFESNDNPNLPDFVCRFKHYTLNTHDKRVIYSGANIDGALQHLKGRKINGLAQYFFPRMLNKRKCIYDKHVIVRLNYTDFKKLWNGQNKTYSSLDELIAKVKSLENVETINITLENVAQKIAQIQNKRQNDGTDASVPFDNVQQLKDKMMQYYFEDKNTHFKYTRNQKESAEYVVRAARTLAENRFKKHKVNQLSVSDHNQKGVRGGTTKTEKDIFFSALVTMHNLSEKKALGITAKYPTIGALMREYKRKSASEGELLLANIRCYGATRIGPAISKRVYRVFYKNTDGEMKMN